MSSDTKLQEAVLSELNWEPSVAAGHIGVSANAGVVTLTGRVSSLAEKHAAEVAALRVRGVKAVVEKIEVQLPVQARRTDADIAAAAIERLAWDVSVPADAITIKVENGQIVMEGKVDWYYQKDAAEQALRSLRGVVGVTNEVTIKSKVDTSNISDDITHALHRSWFFDPPTVSVTASGGTVRLTGTVHSQHERQVAASIAWAAPGVTKVENHIAVA